MSPRARRVLFERLRAANPSPRTELVYRTPYQLLVAVVLSAQATDKSVNAATARLFGIAGTPERMASSSPATPSAPSAFTAPRRRT